MHDLVRTETGNDRWVSDDRPLRVIASPRARRPTPASKRLLDLVGSVFGIIFLSPLFALVALAIRLDSPGRALYRQTRIGLGGVPFEMLKFRTMSEGNDSEVHRRYVTEMIRDGGDQLRNGNGAYKLENDRRITRVGKWLRATSLDEFPQLLNVLKGEMSLVGPRPPLPYEVEVYSPRHHQRLEVLPGMTGLWQVSGRNETTFEEMVDFDISYIEKWSLFGDLQILGRTVAVLMKERGA